jgi:hypothetical protein
MALATVNSNTKDIRKVRPLTRSSDDITVSDICNTAEARLLFGFSH